jgi:hypothetical protein
MSAMLRILPETARPAAVDEIARSAEKPAGMRRCGADGQR